MILQSRKKLILSLVPATQSQSKFSRFGSSISYPTPSVADLSLDDVFIEMIKCGGGTFKTGMDDNEPEVTVGKFFIRKTEVTYKLWKTVYDWVCDDLRGDKKYRFANSGRHAGDMKLLILIKILLLYQ